MSEDLSDLMKKLNNMMNSDSAPDNLKNIFDNFSNSTSSNDTNSSDSSSTSSTSDNSQNFNIDIDTILKIQSIMSAFNTKKDDPRANLLLSLKPYLKDSRKGKLDQYVKLLNMSTIMDVFKESGGEKKNES